MGVVTLATAARTARTVTPGDTSSCTVSSSNDRRTPMIPAVSMTSSPTVRPPCMRLIACWRRCAGRRNNNQNNSAIPTNGSTGSRLSTTVLLWMVWGASGGAADGDARSAVERRSGRPRVKCSRGCVPIHHSGVEQREIAEAARFRRRRRQAEVLPRRPGRDASARRTRQEAAAHQERLCDLLHRLALLSHRYGERGDADRTAAEAPTQGVQYRPVEPVEAEGVDLVEVEGTVRHVAGDDALGPHLGVVAHPAEQAVCDARCPPGP